MKRKRKKSKKARAKRIYAKLYRRLMSHHNAVGTALHSGDIREQARQSMFFTKMLARACTVERLSGVPWDIEQFLTPSKAP